MDPNNSFSGKVYFTLIDKVLIGIIAAAVTFFFQMQQYKYQLLLNAKVAASKINTDILLQQRAKLIEEIGAYSRQLEEIKSTGKAKDDQIISMANNRHQINFIIETLGAVDDKIEKSAERLLSLINDLNSELATNRVVARDKLTTRIDDISTQYMYVLEVIQFAGVCKTMQEFETATKPIPRSARKKASQAGGKGE